MSWNSFGSRSHLHSPARVGEILEPLEQNTSDHLMLMETSSINTFRNSRAEHTQPSANVGLPGHLLQCHLPQCHRTYPAYTTYTAPVVKMLVEQDGRRRHTATRPVATEQSTASPGAATAGRPSLTSIASGGSSCEGVEGSAGKAVPKSSLPPPSVCRVIFARKAPLRVAPCSKKK
ncbi:Golgi apparatus membrane protein TVP23 homolog C isoform X3 [Tympanuchus pallidicinctus]|uniref:Golgi apparatus membrane protein TVP23 homolog C isoform X3 n=1 Tax=Tympanuchus pallidicinctus TaxID=109042 RepID=UPI002287383A|nr:Golgi apparatus membrane protein TVP23 homolog C isoform X3 [Tympanuchus pallidicinctus]